MGGIGEALTDDEGIAAGPTPWDLSCPDWWQRLQDGRSLVPDLPLDRERADRAVRIFKKLRIPDVPGTPALGDAADKFIFDIVAAMFGAYDAVTSQRMIRGYFTMIPKKNAKTTYFAAIALTGAILNKRPMAELICTGPSQEVSGKAYSQAKGMIALDSEGYLQKRFHVRDHIQTIEDRNTAAKLKIKTFDASIVTGAVLTMALIDEVHLLGEVSQAAAIIQQMIGGMVSVPEAFWAMITTQSFKPPAGAFKSNLKVARGIRDGRIKTVDTLPILYELPEDKQKDRSFWEQPRNWRMVNPNEGRSTFIPTLVKDLARAREEGDEAVRIWFSQHVNIEIGLALQSDAWAGAKKWEARADKSITFAELLRRCEVIVFGIDGGGLDDLLGFNASGRCRETKQLLSWSKAWAHRDVLEERKDIAPRLQDFEKDGDLVLVDKMADAFDQAADYVEQAWLKGLLYRVCLDRAGLAGIVTAIKDKLDLTEEQALELFEGVHQGWQLSGTIKDTEGKLSDGKLLHAAQPLMDWCVGNAKQEAKGNAIAITKQVAGTAKIDPLIALFIAMSQLRLDPEAPGRSIYDRAALWEDDNVAV